MCISKGGIDLNGSRITLKGTLDVLHLFKGVTHIRISISKRRLNPALKEGKKSEMSGAWYH